MQAEREHAGERPKSHQRPKSGGTISYDSCLIAGQARARQLTLVTHNTAEFARVPYLRIEDWSRGRKRT